MPQILQQAFGDAPNLYQDVLQCSKDASMSQLRKAYYQQALKYHPDKNPDGNETTKLKFQAISWAYNYLKDPERRQDYDEEGILPHDDDIDETSEHKDSSSWKNYFDIIFGKLSTKDIDDFGRKYKMSEEEESDVLKHYISCKGNLLKMLEYVMLSEERDVPRWVEDYIEPGIREGRLQDFKDARTKSLAKVQAKLEKENRNLEQDDSSSDAKDDEIDPDETETESSEDDADPKIQKARKPLQKKKKKTVTKAKPTKKKKKKASQASSQDALIAAIRNKKRGNPLAGLAARYGVTMDDMDEDPLDDDAFNKVQSKMMKKNK